VRTGFVCVGAARNFVEAPDRADVALSVVGAVASR
jgi:hypothetical protein